MIVLLCTSDKQFENELIKQSHLYRSESNTIARNKKQKSAGHLHGKLQDIAERNEIYINGETPYVPEL